MCATKGAKQRKKSRPTAGPKNSKSANNGILQFPPVSDCEHVDEAELAEFDVERWKQDKVEEQHVKIIATNGTILHISLAILLLCLLVVCLVIAAVYGSPLCLDHGFSHWTSLQYFLMYDTAYLALSLLITISLVLLARLSYPTQVQYPEYTILFAQICGSLSLVGMFALQVLECSLYGKVFITTDSICPLPVATITIVMNLLFFGGPLLVLCCLALGRTSALNFSDEVLDAEDEGEEEAGGEGGEGAEGEYDGAILVPQQVAQLAEEEQM